jgi:GTPase SAR1 family protein
MRGTARDISNRIKRAMAKASSTDELPDPDLKIILLGDSAVGKSKLIERYLMDEYNPRQVIKIFQI